MNTDIFSSTVGIVIFVFVTLLVTLWTLLPFAVFGVKAKLDDQINQNNQIISLLKSINTVVAQNKKNYNN